MRHAGVFTFFLALGAFLAIGGGALLLVSPGHASSSPARVRAATAPAGASVEQAAEPSPTPTPADFALLSDVSSISRPDSPSRLLVPSISLDTRVTDVGVVVEGGKPVWDTAAFVAGYHRGTALPGERGNLVISGHISSPVSKKGDVFRHLPEVRIGDRVDVWAGVRRFTYEVASVRVVSPTAIEVMDPTPDASLTLITCYPDAVYNQRLVVVAKLSGKQG